MIMEACKVHKVLEKRHLGYFFFLFSESTQDSVAAKVYIRRADGCEKDIQLHRDNREKQRGREQGNVWKQ